MPLKVAIVAGELSGDQLAAGLVRSIKAKHPDAEFYGIAGPKMQAEGVKSLFPLDVLSVMGLVEVIKHLPTILKVRRGLLSYFKSNKPDIFIGVDAPDFNLTIAAKLKPKGVKTVQYVSPSVWAWREGRVHKIKRVTDLVLCILPFETDFYKKHNHKAVFVGHPLADKLPLQPVDVDAKQKELKLTAEAQYLAILPGSRKQELQQLLPVFIESFARCKQKLPELKGLLPVAKPSLLPLVLVHKPKLDALGIEILSTDAKSVMAVADVVLLASGTATLEAMLLKKPMVVAYKMSNWTYKLVRHLVKAKYAALPNLLADKELVPEFIQQAATAENISSKLVELLQNKQDQLLAEFTDLHKLLQQDADRLAAEAVLAILPNYLRNTSSAV